MKQKILLIIALFAIVVGARAQTLYKSNVVVEKNELLESNVTVWKRWAKQRLKKEQLDARLQDFAQRPTEIKDIEYYEMNDSYSDGVQIKKPYHFLIYYQKEVGNVRNSFQGEFDLYKNPDGTPHHAVVKSLREGTMSAGDIAIHWIINEVEYEGLTYPVTEVGDEVCQAAGGGVSENIDGVVSYHSVVGITMQNLTTVGEHSFFCGGGYVMFFQNLETLNLPNLTTVGEASFDCGAAEFNGENYSSLKVLNLPNLETIGQESFCGNFPFLESIYVPKLKVGSVIFYMFSEKVRGVQHTNVYLPIDVLVHECGFIKSNGGVTFHILDNDGRISNLSAETIVGGVKNRFLVPLGKAQALAQLWALAYNSKNEVYSPVPVSKANDGYGTMVIEPGDAWASYTQDGVTYANYYDFNRALTAADVEKPFDGTDFNAPEDYRHKWFVATSYTDNNKQEGTLTITSPNKYGVRPGDGFLWQGPAFSGTGDGVMWVPVACNGRISRPYTDTNYFKAGTGAAVPRESDGCRNFYYTSPTGFWECRNTVIPTNRAYLALPSEMTANAKQISFVIDDGEGEVTGIVSLTPNPSPEGEGGYYSLDGRKLNGKPTTKGIYLHNGRKEVIK